MYLDESFRNRKPLMGFVILISHFLVYHGCHASPISCNASLSESCPALLYYVSNATRSREETAALFNVDSNVVNKTVDGFLIGINCSCLPGHDEFTWHVDYQVQPGDTWESVSLKFGSFVVRKQGKTLVAFRIATLDLFCGCSENVDVIMTYSVKKGDTLYTICSQLNANTQRTVDLNGIMKPSLIHDEDVIFIPNPDFQNLTFLDNKGSNTKEASCSRSHILIGATIAAFGVILFTASLVSWNYYRRKEIRQARDYSKWSESKESILSSLNSSKTTVFPYQEVCIASSNYSLSSKIGQGSYGSVFRGKLRGNGVAIKQMKNTKSKEFLSEVNILCKVHHSNLIKLIGYAAGGDSLFLIYEFAQNGALSDHLHKPTERGYKPLSWTTRVQIALDAAKGLEYIHQHITPSYVHRDVKTSNILLDTNFHAKIADFGLVKLLEHSPEAGTSASRIVGTFGYLAPEYVRDGHVTTKSDVYAFSVVLMELLTGQPALSRDTSSENNQFSEHRSLVDYMLSVLNDTNNPMTELTECIDPNLTNYHKDSIFQMALLSKDCVDEDWKQRPEMSVVVLRLSRIFTCSEEWHSQEFTLHTA